MHEDTEGGALPEASPTPPPPQRAQGAGRTLRPEDRGDGEMHALQQTGERPAHRAHRPPAL